MRHRLIYKMSILFFAGKIKQRNDCVMNVYVDEKTSESKHECLTVQSQINHGEDKQYIEIILKICFQTIRKENF